MKTSKLAVTKEMKLTDVQEELCMFFNDCFFQSDSNPIRMAKKLTKKFDVTTKKKRKK